MSKKYKGFKGSSYNKTLLKIIKKAMTSKLEFD